MGPLSEHSDLQETLRLLRRWWGVGLQATNGLVAHGANAADLQPFQQTPEADGHVRSVSKNKTNSSCMKQVERGVFVHSADNWLYW